MAINSPVFLDANIPMYAAGRKNRYKAACTHIIERVAAGALLAVTDAEVFQEILYRYFYIDQSALGHQIFRDFRMIVPDVLPVRWEDVELADELLQHHAQTQPRDALHVAVMIQHGISRICSVDRDFDPFTEIRRIDPLRMAIETH